MRKFVLSYIILYSFPHLAFCQQSSITGHLADSTSSQIPFHAVISILSQQDSTLVSFTRSDKNGNFSISKLDTGRYTVIITYSNYADYVDQIKLKPDEHFVIGTIYLTGKAKLLHEIVIQQAAMQIEGDTTEYNAGSYKVKPNATVEDLLKQLPGIQVDKNGKITAQGQQVQKILVDGDEFFSDDPTIATRNLRADAVSKVQVFDKKSDQAEFTGIDDGNTTKTINLKLNDKAKHGYFGKFSAGALDKYYNGQALINAFKNKRKLAAFAVASSTNATGLDFGDAMNYGFSGNNISIMEGGGIMISGGSGGNLGTGNYYGDGLPESVKAGLHFSNKWNDDKYNMGGNYLFNKLAVHSSGNTYTQNILADSVYYDREASVSHSDNLRHSLSGTSEIKLDSSSSVKITANGYTGTVQSSNEFQSKALSEKNQLVNSSSRRTSNKGNNSALNANALWRKKFKKKGRTLSVNFEERYSMSNSNGSLNNMSEFYDLGGSVFKKDTTDQDKVNENNSNVAGIKATYTEPLSKKSFLEFNYSVYNNSSTQRRSSYDRDLNGKYTELVDSLSNDFKYIYNTHSGGINYRFNQKDFNFSFGGNIANTAFQQSDLVKDTTRKYHYINLAPQANLNYKINNSTSLRFNYNGNTQQPTIDQLQPLTNNDNPLNTIVGNPDLKQEFIHRFNLSYNNYSVFKKRSIYMSASLVLFHNFISSSSTIDALGKRTTKSINVNGDYSGRFYGGYNFEIPKTKIQLSVGPDFRIGHNTNFINSQKNITKVYYITPRISLYYYKEEKYNFNLSVSPTYSQSESSISTVAGTHYWTYDYSFDGSIYPVKKLEIGSDIDFNFRQKMNAFDQNNNVILWNAYIEKKFFKNEALTLRLSIHDILDQNKGYDRNIQPNSIVERHYLSYQRYGLITLTWNFKNRGGKGAPKSIF